MTRLIDPALLDEAQTERLLMKAIVPRPVVWITTMPGPESPIVLAPFSAVTPICNSPPLLVLSVQRRDDGARKATALNILSEREFVVNVLDENLIESAVGASNPEVPTERRLALAGVHPEKSILVSPPRISECVFSVECVLRFHKEIGQRPFGADLFIAEIVYVVQNIVEDSTPTVQTHFCGVGALDREWYLTRAGLRRVPQP